MKNILVDMNRLDKDPNNGLYSFSYNLGKSLARHQFEDGLDLHFYLGKRNFGVFGHRVNYELHNSLDKYFMFGTAKFDVWHVTTSISWYRPFNSHTKNIFTLHDLNFITDEKNTEHNKRLLKRIQKRVDRADQLTAISNFVVQQAWQYLKLKNKPITVIYNGCNIPDISGPKPPQNKPVKPFLFSIGLVQEHKNFHTLPSLLIGNNFDLVIAGRNDFEYGKKIIDEAKKHNVENRVKLLGPVSEEEKFWLYQNCLAFCFPSLAEGFGLPVLEAMHFGKPVFLSKSSSLPEVGGDAAYYFDSFDPEDMRSVFEAGMKDYVMNNRHVVIKERTKMFSWDSTAIQYLHLYKSLSGAISNDY